MKRTLFRIENVYDCTLDVNDDDKLKMMRKKCLKFISSMCDDGDELL